MQTSLSTAAPRRIPLWQTWRAQLLSRAVGYRDFTEPDIAIERLSAQDVFLLCSNGLSDVLERHQMAEVMARASSIEDACSLLVEAAVAAGAEDDVTAVLAQPATPPEPV